MAMQCSFRVVCFLEFCRAHFLGICSNTYRDFVIGASKAPKAAKLALSGQPDAISQPTGTHPIPRLISTSKDGKVESNTAGEKLHQKKHWRDHRMLLDLKPLVEEGSELDKVGSSIIFFDQVVGHYWPVC